MYFMKVGDAQNHLRLDARKPVFRGLLTTKAHPRRLISAFVIQILEIMSKLPTMVISIFLASLCS